MSANAQSCICYLASEADTPKGASEVIQVRGKAVKRIHGVVLDSTGEPVNGAVVEIYSCGDVAEDVSAYKISSDRKRITACKTATEGAFCFEGLPPERYLLRAGTNKADGWIEVYMRIILDRRWWSRWRRSGRRIELTLGPGI